MKFGKRLLSELNPEWGLAAYVRYDLLKVDLKAIDGDGVRATIAPPEDAPQSSDLLKKVETELEKVIAFYTEQSGGLPQRLQELNDKETPAEPYERLHCLLKVLQDYCHLNVEGFEKFHKKYVKHSHGRDTVARMDKILETARASVLATNGLEASLGGVAEVYATRFCNGDRAEAVQRLRRAWHQDPRSQKRVIGIEEAAFFRRRSLRKEKEYALRIVTGTSNVQLAEEVAQVLNITVENARVGTFANGEIDIKLLDNVRGDDVFVVQTHCGTPEHPDDVNKSVMELLLLMHTLRLASARRVTAVVPYMAYSRQDRKTQPRVPISGAALALMMMSMGMDRLVTVDLHCGQIQGFFGNTPVDNLFASKEFVHFLLNKGLNMEDVAVVSPDAGGVERARLMADALRAPQVVTILKRRVEKNKVDSMQLVGDVRGKICIIVDDIIDTGGTLVKAAKHLGEAGATSVIACATHGILTHPACSRINSCDALVEVVVTDSIPQSHHLEECSKLRVLTTAPLIAEAMSRIHSEQSLSQLFAP